MAGQSGAGGPGDKIVRSWLSPQPSHTPTLSSNPTQTPQISDTGASRELLGRKIPGAMTTYLEERKRNTQLSRTE